jgi:cytochrome oxidase Cu insertion factor (SCO1/SenC/PrrC family)
MRIAMPTTTLVAALFMVISTMATAQTRTQIDVSALGPQVGEKVPDFDLPDQNGLRHTLETVRGPNGSLILFHRSADW